MKNSKWGKKTRTVNCVHGLVVLKHFHCSANLCLLFNIIPSVETFTQRAETGTNRTLLSICDLPTPHPPSECIATMEKHKGEGGRLPRYSGSYWWYTSSRIEDWVQRTDVRKRATCMQDILKIKEGFLTCKGLSYISPLLRNNFNSIMKIPDHLWCMILQLNKNEAL